MNVESFMKTKVITVTAENSLMDATKVMKQHGIKHLPVMDAKGMLVGVVTDRDLKRASASDATTLEIHELLYLLDKINMEGVMTKNPVTVTAETTAQAAAQLMVKHKIGCLPVVKGESLVGIVTKDDLLGLLARGQ